MISFVLVLWVVVVGLASLIFGKEVALAVVVVGVIVTTIVVLKHIKKDTNLDK